MLGVNLLFAGFALTLNGIAYRSTTMDNRVKAIANILVGLVIGTNAIFQTSQSAAFWQFGFAAAMWMFSLNYFLIAAHILLKAADWKIFGIFSGFAAIVSLIFLGETIFIVIVDGAPDLIPMIYLWVMWMLLWLQNCLAVFSKAIDKLSPFTLILNGVASTFIPGALILLGVILL
ncbi:MAG: AmiS/UreI family transporter [Defluviitaleaceae bacterium]|nr:AmiS/UreI family transporter [Defluviitaleaceae bacterium]